MLPLLIQQEKDSDNILMMFGIMPGHAREPPQDQSSKLETKEMVQHLLGRSSSAPIKAQQCQHPLPCARQ